MMPYHPHMPMSVESPAPTRVIAVVLSEDEWRAFREAEAEPVAWLQDRIRERIDSGRRDDAPALRRMA